jgi:GNAT superfamily N-acetyltransferase
MAGEILPLQTSLHSSLQIKRTDEAGLLDYADVNCEAYGFPLEWGRSGLSGSTLWTEKAYSFLGYENDRAASAIANDGCLYLALVATRPDLQRKGYAEAVVRPALQAAHEATGLKRTILHATDAGYPVYQRVGYHRTANLRAYKVAAAT